jgi:hypothetical protein
MKTSKVLTLLTRRGLVL